MPECKSAAAAANCAMPKTQLDIQRADINTLTTEVHCTMFY